MAASNIYHPANPTNKEYVAFSELKKVRGLIQ